MPFAFKPVAVKPIPKSAVIKTVDGGRDGGRRVACWTNRRNRKVIAELTDDGTRCRVESPTWWVEYTNHLGKRDRKPGFKDKSATLKLGYDLETEAEDIRSGRASRRAPDSPEHLADCLPVFREHLESKGRTVDHVNSVLHNVSLVVAELRLTVPASVDCERVARWLSLERKKQGWSAANLNRYVLFLKQFGRWLVKTRRARYNPFDQLDRSEDSGEPTRRRRRLPDAELATLIATTVAASPDTGGRRWSLAPPDRARLYLLAAYTGFRMSTLAKITPEAFRWEGDLPASVSASGLAVKNRKSITVPLHPAVAAQLADWLRACEPGKPIFPPGSWSERGAKMLAYDLRAARATWIAEAPTAAERASRERSDVLAVRDAAGDVFDFHALRVQFISGLAVAGVPLTAAQQLAGHSTPSLTANVYTRWQQGELAGEVAKLPGLVSGLHAKGRQQFPGQGNRKVKGSPRKSRTPANPVGNRGRS